MSEIYRSTAAAGSSAVQAAAGRYVVQVADHAGRTGQEVVEILARAAATLPLAPIAALAVGEIAVVDLPGSWQVAVRGNVGGLEIAVAAEAATVGTRAYGPAEQIAVTAAGTVRSAAIAADEVMLASDVDAYVRVGDGSVTAAPATGLPLFAGSPFHLRLTAGQRIAVIRRGTVDGTLSIVPVL